MKPSGRMPKNFIPAWQRPGWTGKKFIEVLDCLINGSDQSDAYVHVSWF